MKVRTVIIAILAILSFPSLSFAQLDCREPGIYAIVNGESIPLQYFRNRGIRVSGGWVSNSSIRYEGDMNYGTIASDTFVLVNDPKRFAYMAQKPFNRNLTPAYMVIIPLTINPERMCREYDPRMAFRNGDAESVLRNGGVDFDWVQISDNSYSIKVHGLVPGEYGIAFSAIPDRDFDYISGVFAFTIPDSTCSEPAIVPAPETYFKPERLTKHENSDKPIYHKSPWQFVWGYVNKSWICSYPGFTQREDFFGDSADKFIHGCNLGVLVTPSLDNGLGVRTGLLVEVYVSRSRWIKEFCDQFSEMSLYIPLHASYTIPLKREMALTVYGGGGFQWAVSGDYKRILGGTWRPGWRPTIVYDATRHVYGNGWPQKVNWQAELGLEFRWTQIGVHFTYSYGLTDHKIQSTFDEGATFVTADKSRQDKMSAALLFFF